MNSQTVQIDVIVIGSGISGMSAAHKLASNGRNVLVLEANDYIGGRLKSFPITLPNNQQLYFQYGASWIHGKTQQNPISQLADKILNIKTSQTDWDNVLYYDQDGKDVQKQTDEQYQNFQLIKEQILQERYQNLSIYDAISKIYPQKLNNNFFMYYVSQMIEFQTSACIQHLSAQYGLQQQYIEGPDHLVLSRYQSFPQHLSKHKNIQVLLDHTVVQITAIKKNSSIVKCANGSTFCAKKIIISVPLGVLKKKNIKFIPQLPQWKYGAINGLNIGNICKILIIPKIKVQFPDNQYWGIIPTNIQKRGSAVLFLNLWHYLKVPALMTFGFQKDADQFQKMSVQELKRLLVKKLSVFTDIKNEDDFDIIRSSWRSDVNFGGAYTYASIDSKEKDWQNMAKPIFSCGWYFCGEHANRKHRASVHGAYISGQHTAQYIIDNLTEQNWNYLDNIISERELN